MDGLGVTSRVETGICVMNILVAFRIECVTAAVAVVATDRRRRTNGFVHRGSMPIRIPSPCYVDASVVLDTCP
ncbi:hypothetical protein ANCCAN_30636 [Ancylostoma caninum]|uniref:Uncharacterized protein n=1 Tax=Ancylostoma caninum TaxID=29170 RepID=A0A368EWM9_ANCCA|nr:hypothetical protein ANCCAN_30636 [Ancylostoma caninum]